MSNIVSNRGRGRANGENILLITLARTQHSVEDRAQRGLAIFQ